MVSPVLAFLQAGATLLPLFNKSGPTQKTEAMAALKDNLDPATSSVGHLATGAAIGMLVTGGLEEPLTALITAIVGIVLYFIRAKA